MSVGWRQNSVTASMASLIFYRCGGEGRTWLSEDREKQAFLVRRMLRHFQRGAPVGHALAEETRR